MLNFFIGKFVRRRAQKYIDKLNPDVSIYIPKELPLPSVGIIKKMSSTVSKVNALEDEISCLSDDQLKAKTEEFKLKYNDVIKEKAEELKNINDEHRKTENASDRENISIQIALSGG